ncbi:MAG TPA: tetratricopeptide repeat protein [Candidatus Desulfofervidus auxilii]|uniref:Tetratricopeptide repeat protein n=1 Tax=Desulfofervidus auxilii TaxID=1621989 RepID=A0A7C0Y6Y4_DESA2|nr:tetratricopeptide repeat protein [Candidatus Desulfofervidus auxilii]
MLNSSFKKYTYGQDKACSPTETIKKALNRLYQDKKPILKEILRIDTLDKIGIPVYTCKLNLEVIKALGFEETFGKGITPEQAQASALMELVERYSGFSFLKKNFLIDSFIKIKEKAIPIENLLLPLPFLFRQNIFVEKLRNVSLCWIEAYNLIKNKKFLFPLPWFYRIYGTTGWAAGNSLEEAILQAICEIVERHCVSIVMEERLEVPTIKIDSINSSLIQELLKKISDAGIELFIKDFSLGLGIPTIAVIAHDPSPPTPTLKVYAAAGTHLNSNFALIRALIEFTQHRAQIIYRELIQKRPGGPTYCFLRFKDLKDANFLIKGDKIPFSNLPSFSHPDFKVEIEYILNLISQRGFEVFVIETTHPSIQLPSVIVTIPGVRLNRPSTKLHPYLLLARQFMDLKDYKKALSYIEETFEDEPSYRKLPQILCQAAVCAKKANNYQKALKYYEEAVEIAPYLLQSEKFVFDFAETHAKIFKSSQTDS